MILLLIKVITPTRWTVNVLRHNTVKYFFPNLSNDYILIMDYAIRRVIMQKPQYEIVPQSIHKSSGGLRLGDSSLLSCPAESPKIWFSQRCYKKNGNSDISIRNKSSGGLRLADSSPLSHPAESPKISLRWRLRSYKKTGSFDIFIQNKNSARYSKSSGCKPPQLLFRLELSELPSYWQLWSCCVT